MTNVLNKLVSKASLRRGALIVGTTVALVLVALGTVSRSSNTIPTAHAAQADYYLKIEGIDGESTDAQHPGTIQLESWSWGVSNSTTVRGGGLSGGKVSFQDLHFTSKAGKASPMLMMAVAKGQHIPKATLSVRKAGTDQQDFYKVTLSDVMVSSYQSSGEGTNDVPMDQVSISFGKIEYSYSPQSATGSLDKPLIATYDLKKATKL